MEIIAAIAGLYLGYVTSQEKPKKIEVEMPRFRPNGPGLGIGDPEDLAAKRYAQATGAGYVDNTVQFDPSQIGGGPLSQFSDLSR